MSRLRARNPKELKLSWILMLMTSMSNLLQGEETPLITGRVTSMKNYKKNKILLGSSDIAALIAVGVGRNFCATGIISRVIAMG